MPSVKDKEDEGRIEGAELLEHTQGDCAVIPLEYWNKIKQLIKGETI